MAFTFSQARKLSPEEANPMNALISRAMETFGKGMNLSYLPREKEASIFSKEIGPLAALASSPNFTGFNEGTQKQIAQRISQYLGSGGQGLFGQGAGGAQQQDAQATSGDQSDGSQANVYAKRTRQGLTKEQVPAGTVSYDENGNPIISPTSSIREDAANSVAGGKTTNDLFDKLVNEIKTVKNKGGFEGWGQRAALTAEGTNIPFISNAASAVVPPRIRTMQNKLEAALIKYQHEDPKSAHYAVQKHPGESTDEWITRLQELKQGKAKESASLSGFAEHGIPLNQPGSPDKLPAQHITNANSSASTLIEMPDGYKAFIPNKNLANFKKKYPGAKTVNFSQQ